MRGWWLALLLLTLICGLPGCQGREPSVMDPPVSQQWYDRHARKLDPYRNSDSPITDRCVLSVSACEDTFAWLEQTDTEVQLWVAPIANPRQGRQVTARPLDKGFYELNLAVDGTSCLLLRHDPELSDPRQQAILELWDLSDGQYKEISRTASAYFLPSWLGEGTFVFAETSAGFMRVLEQRRDGSRIQALAHEAKYPRLIISALASKGYVIYDRNHPMDTHCWVRTETEQGGSSWRELWLAQNQIRLLDVAPGGAIALKRDSEDSSRILRLPQQSFDLSRGKFQPNGEELLSLGVADFALMQGQSICYFERTTWGHQLKVLDLASGQVDSVPFSEGPGLGRKFQPAGTSRACFAYEGPSQPVSAGLLDLRRKELRPLRVISATGLEKVRAEIGPLQVILSPEPGSQAPTMLEGYGAFRQTVLPRWDWAQAEWLRRGGRVVIVHAKSPPLEQHKVRAQLLDVARNLGETPLVLRGKSAGGTLALMAMTEEPDLFRAVWADAPVTDLVNFARLPPGELWVKEFGDATIAAERKRLLELSPLHQVSRRRYPLTLLSTTADDKSVDPRHSTRFTQRMEEMADGSPIYFLMEEQGIHGRLLPLIGDQKLAIELLWRAATDGLKSP